MGLFDFFKKKKKVETDTKLEVSATEESEVKNEEVEVKEETVLEDTPVETTEETAEETAEETIEKEEEKKDDEVVMASVKVCTDKEGYVFGALILNDGVSTGLPIDPKSTFKNNDETIEDWKLFLVNSAENKTIGELEYYEAIEKLRKYSVDENEEDIIIRPLTVEEQEELVKE